MMNGIGKIKDKMKGMGRMSNVKTQSPNKTIQYQISKFRNEPRPQAGLSDAVLII